MDFMARKLGIHTIFFKVSTLIFQRVLDVSKDRISLFLGEYWDDHHRKYLGKYIVLGQIDLARCESHK